MQTKPIFDIFSRKKVKKEIKPKILMDYREKNSLVYSSLLNLGLDVEVKELKVGDYIIGDIVIERKTISDFLSSMVNKRLLKQLEELQQYKKKILLIEGIEEHELYSDDYIQGEGINPNAIRGFITSIILRYNVPIIFTKNSNDTSKYISIIANKKDRPISLKAKKRTFDKKEQALFILEGFQGIGPKTAKKLLEKFKTLNKIFNSEIEELEKIIGKKSEIFKILNENF